MFHLLYGSLERYIQLSVTGVNATVNLPGRAYSVFQLLYGSLEGYIQLSVTGVNMTVNLPGRAVLCVPVAVWFSRRIHPIVCNRS